MAAGATVNVSGSGVTVSNVTVVSATQIMASLAIGASAAVGSRNITVTQGSATSAAVAFNITSTAMTLTGITPGSSTPYGESNSHAGQQTFTNASLFSH